MSEENDLYKFAKEQLVKAHMFDANDEYGVFLANCVLELIDVFDNQNHSGFSAFWTLEAFSKLAKREKIA